MVNIYMPRLSPNMRDGVLVSWLKDKNEQVCKGDAIFEIETDKVVCEVEATADGVLREMCFSEGANVNVGAAVAVIEEASNGKSQGQIQPG